MSAFPTRLLLVLRICTSVCWATLPQLLASLYQSFYAMSSGLQGMGSNPSISHIFLDGWRTPDNIWLSTSTVCNEQP